MGSCFEYSGDVLINSFNKSGYLHNLWIGFLIYTIEVQTQDQVDLTIFQISSFFVDQINRRQLSYSPRFISIERPKEA